MADVIPMDTPEINLPILIILMFLDVAQRSGPEINNSTSYNKDLRLPK